MGINTQTTEDINKYVRALFTPGELLTPPQFKELTTFVSEKTGQPINNPTKDEPNVYGLGVIGSYSELNGVQYVYEGSIPGYRFLYTYFPTRSVSIVAALNSDSTGNEWKLFDTVLDKIGNQCKS